MSIIQSTKKFDASGQNYIVSMSAPDVGTTSIYDGWHNVGPTLGQRWHADVGSNGMPPAKTTLCQRWQLTSVQPSLTLCQRWANVRMLAWVVESKLLIHGGYGPLYVKAMGALYSMPPWSMV